jgi:hypothetical protein
MLEISIHNYHAFTKDCPRLFARKHRMRFQWLVLLAYTRRVQAVDQGWVTVQQVAKLPEWSGHSLSTISTDIGRYLTNLERRCRHLVEAKRLWRGPFRLALKPSEISFDLSLNEIAKYLNLPAIMPRSSLPQLYRFTKDFVQGYQSIFTGHLLSSRLIVSRHTAAKSVFMTLADDHKLPPVLRVLSYLAAIRVLDRLGHYEAIDHTLADCNKLMRALRDPVLKVRFHLAKVRRFRQLGAQAACMKELGQINNLLLECVDKSALGGVMDGEGLVLSNMERYQEALKQLSGALEARLVAGDFDLIQSSCFNIGNALHRIGEKHYNDARHWIELAIKICKQRKIGKDQALSEIILAKIELESGNIGRCDRLLGRAWNIVEKSQNRIDRATYHVVRALYFQKQNNLNKVVVELRNARSIYMGVKGFDRAAQDRYLSWKFPMQWMQAKSQDENTL